MDNLNNNECCNECVFRERFAFEEPCKKCCNAYDSKFMQKRVNIQGITRYELYDCDLDKALQEYFSKMQEDASASGFVNWLKEIVWEESNTSEVLKLKCGRWETYNGDFQKALAELHFTECEKGTRCMEEWGCQECFVNWIMEEVEVEI